MATQSFNRDPPASFRGFHDDLPITFYHRNLPHWRQDGAHYFVTFRLADSLPQSKLNELKSLRRAFFASMGIAGRRTDRRSVLLPTDEATKKWEEFTRQQMQRVEKWLDQGMGSCVLKRPELSSIVTDALHHFDNDRYELCCYVVMPNHVHLILKPLQPDVHPLEKLLQSRKRQSAYQINLALHQTGQLWQEESFDRIIRDPDHLYQCIEYIGDNPRRAGLDVSSIPRWVRPEWVRLGWGFGDALTG
mgnify:CR=1 FL=1